MEPTIEKLKAAYERLGYPWNPKFNLIAIRSATYNTNSFNDLIGWANDKEICFFEGTTDPGFQKYGDAVPEGTAVMKAGFYPILLAKGFHKGRKNHPALIQVGKAWFYRKKGDKLFDSSTLFEGIIGANLHSTEPNFTPKNVDDFSKACLVIRRWLSHQKLLAACDASGLDVFDLALLQEKELDC